MAENYSENLLEQVKELQEKNDIYRTFIEKSNDLFYRTDLKGKITFISPSVLELSGYTVDEAIGMKMAEEVYYCPEERKNFIELLNRDGKATNFQAQLKRKDGSLWWASTNAHFYRDHCGKIIGIEGITRDVTDLKNTELSLMAAEERFRLAFHTSPDAINLNRVSDGVYVDVNLGFTDLTGYTREDVIGHSSLEINIWNNPDDRKKLVEGLLKDGYVKGLEAEFALKDGSVQTGLMSASLIKINNEDVILSVSKNISERKKTEEALKQSEQMLLKSQAVARIGSYYFYIKEGFWISSDVLNDVLGIDENYKKNIDSWLALVHPDFLEEMKKYISKHVIGGKNRFDKEYKIIRYNDKKERWLHGLGELEYDSSGEPVKLIGTIQDITGRKQLELQLQQSQKMEAIGTLAGGVAHDFNNLLTVINGYSELAMHKLDPNDPMNSILDQIFKAGMRATNLTGQLLAFSRKQIYKAKVIEINAIIRDMDKMIRRLIGEDIEINAILDDTISRIFADRTQIEQIVMNLVVNSRDAVYAVKKQNFQRKITIETGQTDLKEKHKTEYPDIDPGSYIFISVSDNGVGMSTETKQKLFEPFYTTKEKNKGTGLGLATVYGIVKQNKGHIYVYSELNQGTTMKIYWPVSDDKVPVNKPTKPDYKKLQGQESILFVEDDPAVSGFALQALESLGYTVKLAENGIKAKKLFEENSNHFDLIITDLVMPEMNGKDFVRNAKKIKNDVKVIFVSGYADQHIVNNGLLENGINFIQKPYSIETLAAKIRTVLKS